MATGQELTRSGAECMVTWGGRQACHGYWSRTNSWQNAWSRGEEGKQAMAPGQELTPGQNASLDIRCEPNNGNGQQHGAQVTGFRRSTDIVINKFS